MSCTCASFCATEANLRECRSGGVRRGQHVVCARRHQIEMHMSTVAEAQRDVASARTSHGGRDLGALSQMEAP